jgi:hypothetical protein
LSNLTTTPTPFCSSLPIGRNSNRKYSCKVLFNAGLANWNPCFKIHVDTWIHVEWDMFLVDSENNIDSYADSVSEFIRKCIGDVIPTVTINFFGVGGSIGNFG